MALITMAALPALAQPANSDCASAALLCAQTPVEGNNTGADVIVPGPCSTYALVWYSFTTNSLGGTVDVSVTNIDCPTVPLMDNELAAFVLAGDGSCDLTQFDVVGDCVFDTAEILVTTDVLLPETRYWVVVAGVQNGMTTIPAQCGFSVAVSGPGADIIGVDVSAGPDVTIGEGESTQLQAISPPALDWSPTVGLSGNGIPDPIAAPTSTTLYTLSTNVAGCAWTDDVIVEIIRLIEPPNTFTPNGDGFNDTWEIPSIADYPGAEIAIHDRWGQIVLRSTGYREAWDGTNKGRALSVGTYYYHIQLNQLEGRSPPYTGFVTIVR